MVQFTPEEIEFAQKYPFSGIAKSIVVDSGLTLDSIPEEVLLRAKDMVSSAFSEEKYDSNTVSIPSLLRNEVLAFPLSKIIVSLINRLELYRRFCSMLSASVSKNLSQEQDRTLVDAACELDMDFTLSESHKQNDSSSIFAQVSLPAYLRPEHSGQSKLVNRRVSRGKVLLTRSEFIVLVSMIAGQQLRDSLPVQVQGVPVMLKDCAQALEKEFAFTMRKKFSRTDFGKVAPEAFPPCMAKIYSDLIAGVKVNHPARFAIATFLNSVGMDSEQIINMYRATPNFSEKITRYQVERIAGKKGMQEKAYSSPGCDKMRSYNLCVANCPVTHPIQFYSREIMRTKNQVPVPVEQAAEGES